LVYQEKEIAHKDREKMKYIYLISFVASMTEQKVSISSMDKDTILYKIRA